MHTANVNLIKGVDVAVSAVHHGARHRKRDEKSDGRKEKPALRPITSMRVKQIAEARVVPKQQDDRDRQKNGRSKEPIFHRHDRAISFRRTAFCARAELRKYLEPCSKCGLA